MTFDEKYAIALKELEASTILPSNYNPPLLKILHKLGLKTPPPHYNSFFKNLIIMGIFFGFFWGVFMYISRWRSAQLSLAVIASAACLAGVAFGVCMAIYYKISARKHNLTPWNKI